MKKVVLLAAVAGAAGLAAYKFRQSQREQSLWAEATAEPWEPVEVSADLPSGAEQTPEPRSAAEGPVGA